MNTPPGQADEQPVPVIETDRLRLRGWRSEDVAAYARIVADVDAMRFIHLPASETPSDTIDRLRNHWERRGFGHWAVEDRASGLFIGRLGLLHHSDWTSDPDNVEVGWSLDRSRWGRGLATEGGAAALGYGFDVLRAERIISICDPANRASRRVMEKLGMAPRGTTFWRGVDVTWCGLDRSEWLARSSA